jgi:hypothetical protein
VLTWDGEGGAAMGNACAGRKTMEAIDMRHNASADESITRITCTEAVRKDVEMQQMVSPPM